MWYENWSFSSSKKCVLAFFEKTRGDIIPITIQYDEERKRKHKGISRVEVQTWAQKGMGDLSSPAEVWEEKHELEFGIWT